MHDPVEDVVLHVWRQQRIWSQVASRMKGHLERARRISLLLIVTGAALAVLAEQLGTTGTPGRWLAVVAGAAVGLVPLVRRGANQAAVRDWTRARSVSEALKSEVYAALAGGSAYVGTDRSTTLLRRSEAIVASVGDLVGARAGTLADDRAVPEVPDIDSYLTARVEDQVDHYYRPRAALYRRRLTRLRRIESALGATSVVLAALVGSGRVEEAGAWVAVVGTLGATVAAHAGASRYDHQVVEFERTAGRLEQLSANWRLGGRQPAELVDACEEVISIENQAWMARWVEPSERPPPGVDLDGTS